MAFDNNQVEPTLPAGDKNYKRQSVNHLPKYFRTPYNKKFLESTIDQLTQPGKVEKINGYYGRKITKPYVVDDVYIGDINKERINYQLEPATFIKDDFDNVEYFADYNDYLHAVEILGGQVRNHSKLNSQEYYTWNPNFDWDKFINYRNYYWVPDGPQVVSVFGQQREVTSTYTVTVADEEDNFTYLFSPDGLTRNPNITLYKGQTYRFEINSPQYPIAICTKKSFSPGNLLVPDSDLENTSLLYNTGIVKFDTEGNEINDDFVGQGVIEFTVSDVAPDNLFYISESDINLSGIFIIKDITENTFLNVDKDIIGKKSYTTAEGWKFTNGMKVKFLGNITPSFYEDSNFYVEGVGSEIVLIKEDDLSVANNFNPDIQIPFGESNFDEFPFSEAYGYPLEKDYIVINRASRDGNFWSKYNRWFHRDVLELSLSLTNQGVLLDENKKATKPIIEFDADLQLYNFGSKIIGSIDLIDKFTTDVFSIIEGSTGYNVDGIDITNEMKILFANDSDSFVKNKIYKVMFRKINNVNQISLVEENSPNEGDVVLIKDGNTYKGKYFYYKNGEWYAGQEKTRLNQNPLFELYNYEQESFSSSKYSASQFKGTKIFSYVEGQGNNDVELGFPLSYRTIENNGDILFRFDLLNDSFLYSDNNQLVEVKTSSGFLKKNLKNGESIFVNGWVKANADSMQKVLWQTLIEKSTDKILYDAYDFNTKLSDLWLKIYKNNVLLHDGVDFKIEVSPANKFFIHFTTSLNVNDKIFVKSKGNGNITNNAHYELPINLENNPLNEDLNSLTYGEILDHGYTIIEEIDNHIGEFPGRSNLRDIKEISKFGSKFVKHSSLFNLASYHLLDKNSNIIHAINFASKEYSKFIRLFHEHAYDSNFSGPIKRHVDTVIAEINKNKSFVDPFYDSDMIPINGKLVSSTVIIDVDQIYFPLSEEFNLETLSYKSFQVYKNEELLIYGKDYNFIENFVNVYVTKNVNDVIEVYFYSSTLSNFVAPTPTKLGLYPKFEPKIITEIKPTDEIEYTEPFQCYGSVNGVLGWYYPLFFNVEDAIDFDVINGGTGNPTLIKFDGMTTTLYCAESYNFLGVNVQSLVYEDVDFIKSYVQGHDGSRTLVFKDYRDLLLLELEKRIFNNIKIDYNPKLFDINDFISGCFRETNVAKSDLDKVMSVDFYQWVAYSEVQYTINTYYENNNSFTNNYSRALYNNKKLPGWWRGIYKFVYDTDRPDTHPWEMLGFSIKPDWWENEYGSSPYTNTNNKLWQDLEDGYIRFDNKKNKKYARPGLTKIIPVDNNGKLLSPFQNGIVQYYNDSYKQSDFSFGDYSPIENVWRKSNLYPFSLLKAMVLNNPFKVFSTAFDRSRQKRNFADQIIYSKDVNHFTFSSIVLPSVDTEVKASGLVNYINDYLLSQSVATKEKYLEKISKIENQLSLRIGGFTQQEKFKLLLDSRTPLNEGNVFVPNENYKLFLNKSHTVSEIVYSGVLITKKTNGYQIKGYDKNSPVFNYYPVIARQKDPTLNIGGVSESYANWNEEKTVIQGSVVRYNSKFYRANSTQNAGIDFDYNSYTLLENLPTTGGNNFFLRENFSNQLSVLHYDTILPSIQDVVDFLFGYGLYIETLGFSFPDYDETKNDINNWLGSIKEFVFWTTQAWPYNTLITLSPAANMIHFKNSRYIVDKLDNVFYEYAVLNASGNPIDITDLQIVNEVDNTFSVESIGTDGIYYVRLPLVQFEHCLYIDNFTVFNDVIYNKVAGYRQDRIKVLGYRTSNWTGSLHIPGFIYDDVKIYSWQEWKDYRIGDVVLYKNFYYAADKKIYGSKDFNFSDWKKLAEKPTSQLLENIDYKINQFTDFYDLDSDNFDVSQQRLAQHLTGYQKRTYLENIINDDISQYKFYQGFIKEKGTRNSLNKLFDVLASNDKDSIEFYEEWAIREGVYGAVSSFEELEVVLDENQFRLTNQPVLLSTEKNTGIDWIYRIKSYEVFVKPTNYNEHPFPTKFIAKPYVKEAGYVNIDDINYVLGSKEEILQLNYETVNANDYIWIGNVGSSWAVFKYVRYNHNIFNITIPEASQGVVEIHVNPNTVNNIDPNTESNWKITVGDIIGLSDIHYTFDNPDEDSTVSAYYQKMDVSGFYEVVDVLNNSIIIAMPTAKIVDITVPFETGLKINVYLSVFFNVRCKNISDLNGKAENIVDINDLLWLDDDSTGRWKVLENKNKFISSYDAKNPVLLDTESFGTALSVNNRNTLLAVGSYKDNVNGKVYVYNRESTKKNWQLSQVIEPPENIAADYQSFGYSVNFTADGQYLLVGAPNSSNVKTNYYGDYNADSNYELGSVVKYNNDYWQAVEEVRGSRANILYNNYVNYNKIISETNLDKDSSVEAHFLLTGNYPFTNIQNVEHFIIRVPTDMYEGVGIGDLLYLDWHEESYANQTQIILTDRQPFNGKVSYITNDYLESIGHPVLYKAEYILLVNAVTVIPEIGDLVTSQNVEAVVSYVYEKPIFINGILEGTGAITIYVTNTNGSFKAQDSLFINETAFVGQYELVLPTETNEEVAAVFSGYLALGTAQSYNVGNITKDTGRGLAVKNVNAATDTFKERPSFTSLDYIVPDTIVTAENLGQNAEASYLRRLSYTGSPGPGSVSGDFLSRYFVVRGTKTFTDKIFAGSKVGLYVNDLQKTVRILELARPISFIQAGEKIYQSLSGASAVVFSTFNGFENELVNASGTLPLADLLPTTTTTIEVQFVEGEFDPNELLFATDTGELGVRPVKQPDDNELLDLESVLGLSYNKINKDQIVHDLWDGYIVYQSTTTIQDNYLEPVAAGSISGDAAEAAGYPREAVETGQIVRDPQAGGYAEVVFYERNANIVTLFVKNLNGSWRLGRNYQNNGQIAMDPYPLAEDVGYDAYGRTGIYNNTGNDNNWIVIGDILFTSLGKPDKDIGKLVVFDYGYDILVPKNQDSANEIRNYEYIMHFSDNISGIQRETLPPSRQNFLWANKFSIQASNAGTASGFVNEGIVYIYEKIGKNYTLIKSLLSPDRKDNQYFGSKIQTSLNFESLYKAVISAKNNTTYADPGKLFFLKNGVESNITYNWDYSRYKQYRGAFSVDAEYLTNDVVYYEYNNYTFYKATTTLDPGDFNDLYWIPIDSLIDYLGELPNDQGLIYKENNELLNLIPTDNLYDFASEFVLSDAGEVIAVLVSYDDIDNVVAVYRNRGGYYEWSQNLSAPKNSVSFGHSIDINTDGSIIVVSDPFYDNNDKVDVGIVYVYIQSNGLFTLQQILQNPNQVTSAQFGFKISLDQNYLVCNARSASNKKITTFDSNKTLFDNGFTEFAYENAYSGSVYVYQLFNNAFIYAQDLTTSYNNNYYFGRNLLTVGNHIYVGLPRVKSSTGYTGIVVNYKVDDNIYIEKRKSIDVVDVSKIKKVFLYNKKTKKLLTYLDYIDPLQGKIAGTAEQNLSYKLFYDPAVYSHKNGVLENESNYWTEENVGKLWWDLRDTKFYNPYLNDLVYAANYWNKIFSTNFVKVYEWVKSRFKPSEWDELTGTNEGLTLNITGTTLYGDNYYSERRQYSQSYQTYTTYYYYWVKDKQDIPFVDGRTLSALDTSLLIQDPQSQMYRFVGFLQDNSFVVYNCKELLEDKNVILSIQYWNVDNVTQNSHYQYKLIADGLANSMPNHEIVNKWIDSLVGADKKGRAVPDLTLDEKNRYGTLNHPRQGWFVNRQEALKQLIERVNDVIADKYITFGKDISDLTAYEQPPLLSENLYDTTVDTLLDLDYLGLSKITQAVLKPIVVDGKIITIIIENPGRGYVTTPTYILSGQGSGAEIEIGINELGSIVSANVIYAGKDYTDNLRLFVRPYTVLVNSDNTINGKWSLYERTSNFSWLRIRSQSYNTNLYWEYKDYYLPGYSNLVSVNHQVDYSYQLDFLNINIGDIVKINYIGDTGWLLLLKIDNQSNVDYTINYKVIGKQNGTLKFLPSLYDYSSSTISFDTTSFDADFYDNLPVAETRIIINTILNKIFINELAIETNQLLIASLKYVLSEQKYVDWVFKSSFVKAKHNVGELRNDITFNNDSLPSYQQYFNEVKPYKTKLREFISSYEKVENISSSISDFDLPPFYNFRRGKIEPWRLVYINGQIDLFEGELLPNISNWIKEHSYSITSLAIVDPGLNYRNVPNIVFEGGSGSGAVGRVTLGLDGKITAAKIIVGGKGYTHPPTVIVDGKYEDGGKQAKIIALLDKPLQRSLSVNVKFDRLGSQVDNSNLQVIENFTGTGSKYIFNLTYPIEYKTSLVNVKINGSQLLKDEYTYENVKNEDSSYTKYLGQITLTEPASIDSEIQISYVKNISVLHAVDRINSYYETKIGLLGNDLGQLMDGIDYGGVEVKSFKFENSNGWDSDAWFTSYYDTYDSTYDDIKFTVKGTILDLSNLPYKVRVSWAKITEIMLTIVENSFVTVDDVPTSVFINQFSVNTVGLSVPIRSVDTILNISGEVTDIGTPGNPNFEANLAISQRHFYLYSIKNFANIEFSKNNIETNILNRFESLSTEALQGLLAEGVIEYIVFDITQSLENNVPYNLYKNGVRLDDPYFSTGTFNNPNAVMDTIIGDNTITSINFIDYGVDVSFNDIFILRKQTSDGSFLPTNVDYDTVLSGGNLLYDNAKGIAPEDIIIDGDDFVTPLRNKGPEELIPGYINDSLDIKVYERPTGGLGKINSMVFIGDGSTTNFPLENYSILDTSLFVKIGSAIKKQYVDYNIDRTTNELTFVNAPSNNNTISVLSIGLSGIDVLDIGTFIADGSTIEFITKIKFSESEYNSIVAVRGNKIAHSLYQTEYNMLGIKLIDFITDGTEISYAVFSGKEDKFSSVIIDEFIYDEDIESYKLIQTPFNDIPSEWRTLVKVNDRILNPGYYEKFTVTAQRDYRLKLYQIPAGSLAPNHIKVYLNENEIFYGDHWKFVSSDSFDPTVSEYDQIGSTINLNQGIGSHNDILEVYVIATKEMTKLGGEYRYGYYDEDNFYVETPGILHLFFNPNSTDEITNGDKITVYQFSNDKSLGIIRQTYNVYENTLTRAGTLSGNFQFVLGQSSVIVLDEPLQIGKYYSVYLNNVRLDDPNFGAANSLDNPNALLQTITGNNQVSLDLNVLGINFVAGDVLRIQQLNADINYDNNTFDYYEYRRLRNNIILLEKEILSENYVWVVLNGNLLTPAIDYYLLSNNKEIRLSVSLKNDDFIDLIHFSQQHLTKDIAWRQFKDNLNRDHYKLIDTNAKTFLSQDLYYYDRVIHVDDATKLAKPNPTAKFPGIIFIDNERIEYFSVVDNELRQLRRGTLGTGIKNKHFAGDEVLDQSTRKTLPYVDESITQIFVGDGSTKIFSLDFMPTSINEFEVFLGGVRLRKNPLKIYDNANGIDSSIADRWIDAEMHIPILNKNYTDIPVNSNIGDIYIQGGNEFVYTGENWVSDANKNLLTLSRPPRDNERVIVVRRIGKSWNELGKSLSQSNTDISKILQS